MMTAWIRKSGKGWLKDYRLPKEKGLRKEEKVKEEKREKAEEERIEQYSVRYYVLRCPNPRCRSKNVPCYKTDPPVRYHKCQDCGLNFKSIEKESALVEQK